MHCDLRPGTKHLSTATCTLRLSLPNTMQTMRLGLKVSRGVAVYACGFWNVGTAHTHVSDELPTLGPSSHLPVWPLAVSMPERDKEVSRASFIAGVVRCTRFTVEI